MRRVLCVCFACVSYRWWYPSILTSSSVVVRRPSASRSRASPTGAAPTASKLVVRRRRRVFVRRPTKSDRPHPTDHTTGAGAGCGPPRPIGIRAGGGTTAKDEHAWANAIAHHANRAIEGAMVDRSSISIDHRYRSMAMVGTGRGDRASVRSTVGRRRRRRRRRRRVIDWCGVARARDVVCDIRHDADERGGDPGWGGVRQGVDREGDRGGCL